MTQALDAERGHLSTRSIRTFVLRQGRLTEAQRRALETLLPRWGLPYRPEPLDPLAVFGRRAPLVLEIGSGMGETTAKIAAANPGSDFLAVEVHGPGVGNLLNLIETQGLTNLRVVQHDALEVLEHMIAPGTLAGIHLFFPDPWPKKRHHKRRIVQPGFVALAAERLAPGGYLHCATDWEEYAQWMEAVLAAEPLLESVHPDPTARPSWRPETKFERRGRALGHGVWDFVYRRRAEAPPMHAAAND
jgi:tRNA (guanine-N7-)-methyltransferase